MIRITIKVLIFFPLIFVQKGGEHKNFMLDSNKVSQYSDYTTALAQWQTQYTTH